MNEPRLTNNAHTRDHSGPCITAVPGRVLGSDIEDQAAELADAAARLADLVAAFAREPVARQVGQVDAAAVAGHLSQAAESAAAAAAGLQLAGDRDTGMEIRALSDGHARDVLLTLSDRLPGEVQRALDDSAATW